MTDQEYQYTDEYLKNVKRPSCHKDAEIYQEGDEEKCSRCNEIQLPFTDI